MKHHLINNPFIILTLPTGYSPLSLSLFTANFCQRMVYTNGSQGVFLRHKASVSPGNLLEMYFLRPHPRPDDSKTLRVGPAADSYVH